jgi:hypothetical protein
LISQSRGLGDVYKRQGWSITKGVQVSVLALFALLAIPTRRRARLASDDEMTVLDSFETEAN